MVYFVSLIIAAGLGVIPAKIAEQKGYSFWLWWFYGWMLFIVAIIHVQFIPDKNSPNIPKGVSAADELTKYKKLFDEGILSQEEFDKKKADLLK